MNDLLRLYVFALRSGDRPLARALARALRADIPLRDRADQSLQAAPRGATRWSPGAEAVVSRVLSRLGSLLL